MGFLKSIIGAFKGSGGGDSGGGGGGFWGSLLKVGVNYFSGGGGRGGGGDCDFGGMGEGGGGGIWGGVASSFLGDRDSMSSGSGLGAFINALQHNGESRGGSGGVATVVGGLVDAWANSKRDRDDDIDRNAQQNVQNIASWAQAQEVRRQVDANSAEWARIFGPQNSRF